MQDNTTYFMTSEGLGKSNMLPAILIPIRELTTVSKRRRLCHKNGRRFNVFCSAIHQARLKTIRQSSVVIMRCASITFDHPYFSSTMKKLPLSGDSDAARKQITN